MRPTLVCGGVVVGVAALSAFSQAPNALTQGPAAAFRTGIRLVQVNVVVQDKAGRPVPGLTRADFTLFEDGKEQPIDLFSVVSDQTTAPLPAIAAGDFSNRLDGRAGGAVTVILFDRLNMRLQDQRQARDQIVKALEQIRHEDRVALYLLDSTSVQILHDFTNDSASLLSAFSRQVGRGRPEPDAPPAELAMLQGFLLGAAQNTSNVLFQNRVETTANALEAVANRLAGVRGRKNLVWVSSGFPFVYGGHFETATMQEAADRATRAADQADIAFYPVDTRGLVVNMPATVTTTVGASTFQMPGGGAPSDGPPIVPSRTVRFGSLKALADVTGGRAFYNTNDIANAVRAALDDGRVIYVLGYYPSQTKWDGEFRGIQVKVNRSDIDVRHRGGYLALPVAGSRVADGAARERALRQDARSTLEATAIGLTVHVQRANTPGEPDQNVSFTIHVDPGAVTLEKTGDRWIGTLEIVIAQHAPDGRWIDTAGAVSLGLTNERRDQIVTQGFSFNQAVAFRDDTDVVHVAVRDATSDATGSVVIPAAAIRAALRP